MFGDQTTEAVGNEEDGTLDLVQSTVGDGICQGFSMPTEAFSTRILPEAYNVGVVAVGDDIRAVGNRARMRSGVKVPFGCVQVDSRSPVKPWTNQMLGV